MIARADHFAQSFAQELGCKFQRGEQLGGILKGGIVKGVGLCGAPSACQSGDAVWQPLPPEESRQERRSPGCERPLLCAWAAPSPESKIWNLQYRT